VLEALIGHGFDHETFSMSSDTARATGVLAV
jgi:hypothetical protein